MAWRCLDGGLRPSARCLLSELVVANAEESDVYEGIVKIRSSPAQFVRADIPVLIMVPTFRNQVLIEYFELSETIVVGAEHMIQIIDFFCIGVETGGIEPVDD